MTKAPTLAIEHSIQRSPHPYEIARDYYIGDLTQYRLDAVRIETAKVEQAEAFSTYKENLDFTNEAAPARMPLQTLFRAAGEIGLGTAQPEVIGSKEPSATLYRFPKHRAASYRANVGDDRPEEVIQISLGSRAASAL